MSYMSHCMWAAHKTNQCLAARMIYSFISYSDFIYESTVNAADCSIRSKAVRLGLSLHAYLIIKGCYKQATCTG